MQPSHPPHVAATGALQTADHGIQIPQFADCGRTEFTTKWNDWIILKSDSNVAFCQQCFDRTIAPYPQYVQYFTRAPSNLSPGGVACDMTRSWMRWAWIMIVLSGVHDANLLSRIGNVQDAEGSCPNGEVLDGFRVNKVQAVRRWYCIKERGGKQLDDFTICSFCLQKIYIILPVLRQHCVFDVAAEGMALAGTCDIIRGSSRSTRLMASLIDAAESAEDGPIDCSELEAFIKKYALLGECPESFGGIGKCHGSRQMSDFGVCETCYEDVVRPHAQSPMGELVDSTAVMMAKGFTCDLFSPRMRELWNSCVATGDSSTFTRRVAERDVRRQQIFSQVKMLDLEIAQCQMNQKHYLQLSSMETISQGSKMVSASFGGGFYVVSIYVLLRSNQMVF
jgi:hypothetical protein